MKFSTLLPTLLLSSGTLITAIAVPADASLEPVSDAPTQAELDAAILAMNTRGNAPSVAGLADDEETVLFLPTRADIAAAIAEIINNPPAGFSLEPANPAPVSVAARDLPAQTLSKRETAKAATDRLLFTNSLATFLYNKSIKNPSSLDWADNGCSNSPDNPLGFNFLQSCMRHDFGYRNYKKQGRFTDANRLKLDKKFKSDLYAMCVPYGAVKETACKALANIYYTAVRTFGDN